MKIIIGRNMIRHSITWILAILPVFLSPGVLSQTVDLNNKRFDIPLVQEAPVIDGRISPGEWDRATIIEDLHETTPIEFSATEERTVFRVMYTEDALYVSAYVYDDPNQLTAAVLRNETSLRWEDRVGIIIDPFNNKRSGYQFLTNPNGVRHEAIYTSATSQSFDWATIWEADAEVVEDGWTAEMEIPFKSLTFDPQNDTWGVNFTRDQMSSQSAMAWYSYNAQTNPANSGEMSGLRNLNQGVGLDLIPSFSTDFRENHVAGSSDTELNPSFDLTYKLSSSLNLTMTWNTDFAATEIDDIQLDLDRFSTRLAEKRSFFLTDMDIFEFGSSVGRFNNSTQDPFNSRNIGLNNGTPVDLTGGAKLSGRVAGFDVGSLIIRQEEFNNIDPTNIYIGRVKRSILSQSELGAIFTEGDPASNDSSSTIGVDFTYRNTQLANNRSFVSNFWIQQSDNPGVDGNDSAWYLDFDYPSSDSWYISARVEEVEENFDPRLGFSNRSGARQYFATIGDNHILINNPLLQKISYSLSGIQYNYLDNGDLQNRNFYLNALTLESPGGDEFQFNISDQVQVLRPGERAPLAGLGVIIPPGEYEYTRYQLNLSSSESRPFSVSLDGTVGDYYSGRSWESEAGVNWKPNANLSFDFSYEYTQYDMPGQTVDTRVVEFENVITFSPSLSIVNLIQYENVSDTIGFNSRLRWNLQSGQDIWFVLGHGMRDEDEDGDFTDLESTATFKIRYTLRY